MVTALQLLNLLPFVCWLAHSERQLRLHRILIAVLCYSSVANHSQNEAFRFGVISQLFWLSMISYPIGAAVFCY